MRAVVLAKINKVINKVKKIVDFGRRLLILAEIEINKVNKVKKIVDDFVEAESVDNTNKNAQNQQSQQRKDYDLKLEN